MSVTESLRRFSDDQRAVSAVIGFILIFGMLMLTLTMYQAQIVPQQNAQTEFTHFEETQDELVDVRNAISRTGKAGDPQFPSVTLGTTYQSRILTINPAPAAGGLQTEQHNITIENKSGLQKNISTQFIEYQPGYNELDVESTWYENSVLYTDVSGGDNTIIEEQHLVTDGTELKITAIESGIQQTGTSRTTIEMNRNQSNVSLPIEEGENLTIGIPTRLSDTEYWDVLDDELDDDGPVTYDGFEEGDVNHLYLNTTSTENVSISTVEIES